MIFLHQPRRRGQPAGDSFLSSSRPPVLVGALAGTAEAQPEQAESEWGGIAADS